MFELAVHSDEIPVNWMGIFICPVQKERPSLQTAG